MENKYMLGFEDQNQELNKVKLSVKGSIPSWLGGKLLRVGPGKYNINNLKFHHWFDGAGKYYGFYFDKGNVKYSSRFIDSYLVNGLEESKKFGINEFGTRSSRSFFKRIISLFSQPDYSKIFSNANVNVWKAGKEFISLTEGPYYAINFDSNDLKTKGIFDFPGIAHPLMDPNTGETFNFNILYGALNFYEILKGKGTKLERLCKIMVSKTSYIHSFSLTSNYIVVFEYPLLLTPIKIPLGNKPFIENFNWEPEKKTRILIINRNSGKIRKLHTDSFFTFHHANAYEKGNKIYVDMPYYRDNNLINNFYLDEIKKGYYNDNKNGFRRYILDLENEDVSFKTISTDTIDFPRINEKSRCRDYNFVYGVMLKKGEKDFLNSLVKLNVKTKKQLIWKEEGTYPGEPVFVSKPNAKKEDEGVILSVILDSKNKNSFLLVLDAREFKELARCKVPHVIPFGFHGGYYNE